MPSNPFSGAKSRIKGAKSHLAEFDEVAADFFGGNPFEWHQERRPANWVNIIRLRTALPDQLEQLAFDTILNLRSSLDLAASATVVQQGASNLTGIYFIFEGTEELWDNSKKAKRLPSYAVAEMRRFKPWANGNEKLYALNKLANLTKHQLIAPIVMANTSFIVQSNVMWNGPGPYNLGTHVWDIEKGEIIITETGFQIPIPIEGYRPTFFLAFKADPVVNVEAGSFMRFLCDMCSDIVDALEQASGI